MKVLLIHIDWKHLKTRQHLDVDNVSLLCYFSLTTNEKNFEQYQIANTQLNEQITP